MPLELLNAQEAIFSKGGLAMWRKIMTLALFFSLWLVISTFEAVASDVVIPGELSISGTGNGLVFPDMTVQTTALSFPYNAVISTLGNAFDISNAGSGIAISGTSTGIGSAGSFIVSNAANSVAALYASTNGTGPAVHGVTTGTSNAGRFNVNNAENSVAALYASTNGSGSAVACTTSGNGNAGKFSNTGNGNDSLGGHAGFFETTNAANSKAALYATSNGSGAAIYGYHTGTARAGRFDISNPSSTSDALYATTNGTGNAANFAITNASSTAYALYATTVGGNGNAGYFNGNVNVVGVLTKSSGTFMIDHPLDPRNKYLFHSFVESPDMMNIYNGNVVTDARGYATVTLPLWFEVLNKEFRYQLTVLDDSNSPDFVQAKVVQKITGNNFTIRTSKPETEVSWQVTGIRHDPYAEKHRIEVEAEKPATEKGACLHPEACLE